MVCEFYHNFFKRWEYEKKNEETGCRVGRTESSQKFLGKSRFSPNQGPSLHVRPGELCRIRGDVSSYTEEVTDALTRGCRQRTTSHSLRRKTAVSREERGFEAIGGPGGWGGGVGGWGGEVPAERLAGFPPGTAEHLRFICTLY